MPRLPLARLSGGHVSSGRRGGSTHGSSGGRGGSTHDSLANQSKLPLRLPRLSVTPPERVPETQPSPEVNISFTPTSPEAPAMEEPSEEDLIDPGDNRILLTCHGKNTVFIPSASDQITKIFKANIIDSGWAWKNVDDDSRKKYFEEFKKYFKLEKKNDGPIYETFIYVTGRRYSDTMSEVRKKIEKPKFLTQKQWEIFRVNWNTPKAIALSKKNSANRLSGEGGPSTHTGGSKSHLQHAIDMKNKNPHKRDPTFREVFLHTHKKADGSFVDRRSATFNAQLEAKIVELSQPQEGCNDPPNIDDNEIYLEIVGGMKKGNVYGIGSQACGIRQKKSGTSYSFANHQSDDLYSQMVAMQKEINLIKKERSTDIKKAVEVAMQACMQNGRMGCQPMQFDPTSSPIGSEDGLD